MHPENLNSSSNPHHPENFETPVTQGAKSRPGGTKNSTLRFNFNNKTMFLSV